MLSTFNSLRLADKQTTRKNRLVDLTSSVTAMMMPGFNPYKA
jgi:hypothetical protein